MVANPATIGSTSAKSAAPQMDTSACSDWRSMAPTIIEVTPVAQAVIVANMGPVAPVKIETLPPTILMHALGFAWGGGSLFSAINRRSAFKTASSPPTAELNVTATRGARSGVMSMPLFSRAR